MKNIIISIFIVLFVIACTAEGAWDLLRSQADIFQALRNYDNRIKVTINNSSQNENLINFPVLVILNTSRVTYGNISADGSGIKFISSDFSTELSYEVEEWNSGGDSFFWVKIPSITALSNSDYFWLYYSTDSNSDSTNSNSVWNNRYLAVWHMNDTADTVTDSSTSGLDGTPAPPQQSPSIIPGKIANAKQFNGIQDGFNITPASELDNMGPVTFSFWMLDEGYSNLNYIFKKGDLIVRLLSNETMRFRVTYNITNFFNQSEDSWVPLPSAVWTYFSITWTGFVVHNDLKIYTDAIPLSSTDSQDGSGSRISDTGTDFIIGSDESGNNSFKGRLDEIRISSVVRSPAWISAQYLSMTDTFLTYGPEENVSN